MEAGSDNSITILELTLSQSQASPIADGEFWASSGDTIPDSPKQVTRPSYCRTDHACIVAGRWVDVKYVAVAVAAGEQDSLCAATRSTAEPDGVPRRNQRIRRCRRDQPAAQTGRSLPQGPWQLTPLASLRTARVPRASLAAPRLVPSGLARDRNARCALGFIIQPLQGCATAADRLVWHLRSGRMLNNSGRLATRCHGNAARGHLGICRSTCSISSCLRRSSSSREHSLP
jgi:hypothetical protein